MRLLLLGGHGGLQAPLLLLQLGPDDPDLVPGGLQLAGHTHQLPGRALSVRGHVTKLGRLEAELALELGLLLIEELGEDLQPPSIKYFSLLCHCNRISETLKSLFVVKA